MDVNFIRSEIEHMRRQILRQRKEIQSLQRAGIPTKSAEELLGRSVKTIPILLETKLGCQCGAGMPCSCNDGDDPDISEVITEENKTTRHW
jgi:hypothetical protein